MATGAQKEIQEALRGAETAEVGIQPAVLMNKEIDHDMVGEYTSCYNNNSWAPKIKELIDEGWIVFRIQTEFGINGHSTMIYMAKMKAN